MNNHPTMSSHVITKNDAEGFTIKLAESQYKGGTITHDAFLANIVDALNNLDTFTPRKDDVWLISYPRSGTHWMNEMLCMLLSGEAKPQSDYMLKSFLEAHADIHDIPKINGVRFFITHLQPQFLPKAILNTSKIIYLLRNPKSVASSYYAFIKQIKMLEYDGRFSGFLPMYMDCIFSCWGNWFDHVVNYWQIGKEQNNVMFVFFEELLKTPVTQLKLVSDFLGLDHTLEFYDEVIAITTFEKMKSGFGKPQELLDKYDSFGKENSLQIFRKGSIDDWKNTFTIAQSEMFDAVYKETVGKHPGLIKRITFA